MICIYTHNAQTHTRFSTESKDKATKGAKTRKTAVGVVRPGYRIFFLSPSLAKPARLSPYGAMRDDAAGLSTTRINPLAPRVMSLLSWATVFTLGCSRSSSRARSSWPETFRRSIPTIFVVGVVERRNKDATGGRETTAGRIVGGGGVHVQEEGGGGGV